LLRRSFNIFNSINFTFIYAIFSSIKASTSLLERSLFYYNASKSLLSSKLKSNFHALATN